MDSIPSMDPRRRLCLHSLTRQVLLTWLESQTTLLAGLFSVQCKAAVYKMRESTKWTQQGAIIPRWFSAKAGTSLPFRGFLNIVHVWLNEDVSSEDLKSAICHISELQSVWFAVSIFINLRFSRPQQKNTPKKIPVRREHLVGRYCNTNANAATIAGGIAGLKLYIMNHQLSPCFVLSPEKIPIWAWAHGWWTPHYSLALLQLWDRSGDRQ